MRSIKPSMERTNAARASAVVDPNTSSPGLSGATAPGQTSVQLSAGRLFSRNRPESSQPAPAHRLTSACNVSKAATVLRQRLLRDRLDAMGIQLPKKHKGFSAEAVGEINSALDQFGYRAQEDGIWVCVESACMFGSRGSFGAVRTLLAHGILDPNACKPASAERNDTSDQDTSDQKTLLHLLAESGSNVGATHPPVGEEPPFSLQERAQTLLDAGADINARDGCGRSAWHLAASSGHLDVLKTFVAVQPDLNKRNCNGETAMIVAARAGRASALELLIAACARAQLINDNLTNALMLAAGSGNICALNVMLATGTDINARNLQGHTALHFAVDRGDVNAAQALLRAGATCDPPDMNAGTPLMRAAFAGDAQMVDALIEAGADCNAISTRLHSVAMHAAQNGHVEILKKLQHNGANLGFHTREHGDGLSVAINFQQLEAVRFLLNAGVSCDNCNVFGYPPLMLATVNGNTEILQAMVDAGADCNAENAYGRTATALAALLGTSDTLRILVKANADLDRPDPQGRTPLMGAVERRKFDAVALLLEAGADPHLRTLEGVTAADLARNSGLTRYEELLRAAGHLPPD